MTTQGRYWISTHSLFTDAYDAKEKLKNDNPESVYQIRRGYEKKKGQVFRLVERFKSNQVEVIKNEKAKRGKKRAHTLERNRS